MTFPTAEDIDIMEADEYYWCDDSVIVGINAKNKKEGNEIKQQILSEHIKAEKYDSLMNANSEIVQHNIDITKEHEIVERLKELRVTEKQLTLEELINELESILENKP